MQISSLCVAFKKPILMVLFAVCITGCIREEDIPKLTIDDFYYDLKPDMTYQQMSARFGEPRVDNRGSERICVYYLRDMTEVRIGYSDRILYARQTDETGNVLAIII